MSQSLFRGVYNSLLLSPYLNSYVFFSIMTILLTTIPLIAISSIAGGATEFVGYYVVVKNILPIYNRYSDLLNFEMTKQIQQSFMENGFVKYSSLSYLSKNKKSITELKTKIGEASNAISTVIGWGIPNVISIISAFIGCVYFFFKHKLYLVGVSIFAINAIVYLAVTRHLQKRFFEIRKQSKEKSIRLDCKINYYLPLVQYKEKSSEDIMSLEKEKNPDSYKVEIGWLNITMVTNLTNAICLFPIWFYGPADTLVFMALLNAFSMFNSSLNSLMNFMNQYTRMETDYGSYHDLWKDLTFEPEPDKLDIPSKIHIENLDIKQGNLDFKLTAPLILAQNERILITGTSGGGKSTFINALIGKIKGMTLASHKPENYSHQIVEFFQTIKEKMPTSKISVRELFNNERDEKKIMRCLRIACAEDWINKFSESDSEKKNATSGEGEVLLDVRKNVLDREIEEKISGGEKTRLALATRIYKLKQGGKKVFILDEPEQGSDPPVAYRIIDNIREEFPEMTIIVISHLELIATRYAWDRHITVKDGVVNV